MKVPTATTTAHQPEISSVASYVELLIFHITIAVRVLHSDCRFKIKYPNCRIGLDNFVSLSQSDGNWFWFYFRSDVTMHYTIYSQCLSIR